MSIFETIVNHFNEHIETASKSIESLTPHIAEAAFLAAQVLMDNKKILIAGSASTQASCQQLTHNLMGAINIERPSLPIINLEANFASIDSLHVRASDNYARQIQALAQEGDCLFIIADNSNEGTLIKTIQAAQQGQLKVIILCGELQKKLQQFIDDNCVLIPINRNQNNHSNLQLASLQFIIVQLLSELIEQQLFAGTNA